MAIEKELLDQLLEGRDPETVFTQDGLLDELKKGLSERVLNAELDAHLDAETADGKTNGAYILCLTGRFAGCRGPVLVAMRSPKRGFSGHRPLCYVRAD